MALEDSAAQESVFSHVASILYIHVQSMLGLGGPGNYTMIATMPPSSFYAHLEGAKAKTISSGEQSTHLIDHQHELEKKRDKIIKRGQL